MSAYLKEMPKVELHVHLEGTISASTAVELAARHGIQADRLPLVDGRFPDPFSDFEHFVAVYIEISKLVREPEDLRTIAAAFARSQVQQNVLYTEVTFTAGTHVDNGMDQRAMWEAVTDGLKEAGPDHEIRLIVDAVRDKGAKDGPRTVSLVESSDAPIVGLGLTGIEGSVPEGEFRILREAATANGFGLAVHAGEAGGPGNVIAALDDLGADRIGHGVASARDARLLTRLASEGVPVEVCPSSNVALGLFPTLEEHPLPEMFAAGVKVSINSDDPPFFSTTLTDELQIAERLLGVGPSVMLDLQRRAAQASFAPVAIKKRVLAAIDAYSID
jgi:aminodeoxyfutalosine deaminase